MKTEFGKIIAKSRIDAEISLTDMAQALAVSPAYLCALEAGSKFISSAWCVKISQYLKSQLRRDVEGMELAADLSNKSVDLSNLGESYRELVIRLAHLNQLPPDIEKAFQQLLETASRK